VVALGDVPRIRELLGPFGFTMHEDHPSVRFVLRRAGEQLDFRTVSFDAEVTCRLLADQPSLETAPVGSVDRFRAANSAGARSPRLAREVAKRPPLVLRYTRMLFTQDLKRAFLDGLARGLARETYAQREFLPIGGGMRPLDRPWKEEPWSE
jgi:hypothetical protein